MSEIKLLGYLLMAMWLVGMLVITHKLDAIYENLKEIFRRLNDK